MLRVYPYATKTNGLSNFLGVWAVFGVDRRRPRHLWVCCWGNKSPAVPKTQCLCFLCGRKIRKSDNSKEPSGSILGQQYTIGLGSQNISLNYIWGNTEYVGIDAYPVLYLVNNNIYEYAGVTIKRYQKYYFWEIGANWGDEQFYGGSPQFYFQFGTMINYKF